MATQPDLTAATQAVRTVAARHAALITDCEHLLHAIDMGCFADSVLPVSAFVTPLRVAVADFHRQRRLDEQFAMEAF